MSDNQVVKVSKKEINLSNKTLIFIGLCVFIVAMGIFLLLLGKIPGVSNGKSQTQSNLRLVNELDANKEYEKNSPEWLAIQTGKLGEMLTNGEIKTENVVAELMSMATQDSAKSLEKKKEDYYLSVSDFLKLIRQLDEKVVSTRYAVPVYLNENECYIERMQYLKSLRLSYKQSFKKENGQWKIFRDEPINDFGFNE